MVEVVRINLDDSIFDSIREKEDAIINAQLPPWMKENEAKIEIKDKSVGEFLKHEFHVSCLVDGLIVENQFNAITGGSGSLKSTLVIEMAKCCLRGEDFLGIKTNKINNALLVNRDDSGSVLQNQLKRRRNF